MRLGTCAAMTCAGLASLVISEARALSAEVVYVDDPLTASPKGAAPGVTAGVKGGSFGTGGWTTTGGDDSLWYLIPASIPIGRIEVTMTNVSSANLLDEEHDFLVWYGETDAAEPVGYMPWFRNNSFKGQLRIFGKNGGRPQGASKLELALCPGGSPGYFDTCPDACKDSSIYTFAYMGGGAPVAIPWDASTSYRIVVQWKPGVIAWSRGVESEMTATFPGTYAPKALRVRLGSPRHVAGSVNTMPLGIVFKDLKVVGEPGTPTPVCGSVAPDAGPEDIGAVDTALPELDAATFEDTGAPSPTDTGDPRILPPPKGTDDLLPKDEGDLTGSCACRAVPSPHSTSPWISIAIAALAIVIVQRRRR